MLNGQDLRITETSFAAAPDPNSFVFINDAGKLRQTDFDTLVRQSRLYDSIVDAHNAGVQAIDKLKTETSDIVTEGKEALLKTIEEGRAILSDNSELLEKVYNNTAMATLVEFDKEIYTDQTAIGSAILKSIKADNYQEGVPSLYNPQEIHSTGVATSAPGGAEWILGLFDPSDGETLGQPSDFGESAEMDNCYAVTVTKFPLNNSPSITVEFATPVMLLFYIYGTSGFLGTEIADYDPSTTHVLEIPSDAAADIVDFRMVAVNVDSSGYLCEITPDVLNTVLLTLNGETTDIGWKSSTASASATYSTRNTDELWVHGIMDESTLITDPSFFGGEYMPYGIDHCVVSSLIDLGKTDISTIQIKTDVAYLAQLTMYVDGEYNSSESSVEMLESNYEVIAHTTNTFDSISSYCNGCRISLVNPTQAITPDTMGSVIVVVDGVEIDMSWDVTPDMSDPIIEGLAIRCIGKNHIDISKDAILTEKTTVNKLPNGYQIVSDEEGVSHYATFNIGGMRHYKGKDMTLSANVYTSAGQDGRLELAYTDLELSEIHVIQYINVSEGIGEFTCTIPDDVEDDYRLLLRLYSNVSEVTSNAFTNYTDIQLEFGKVRTTHVLHAMRVFGIPITTPMLTNKITGVADTLGIANDVYGVYRNRWEDIFDGSSDEVIEYIADSTAPNGGYFRLFLSKRALYAGNRQIEDILSNRCVASANLVDKYIDNNITIGSTGNYCIVSISGVHTVDDLRTWLGEQNIVVQYALAEPYFEAYIDQTPFYNFMAFNGATHISVEGINKNVRPMFTMYFPRNERGAFMTSAYANSKLNTIGIVSLHTLLQQTVSELKSVIYANTEAIDGLSSHLNTVSNMANINKTDIAKIKSTNLAGLTIKYMSQSSYDSLTTKDANTLYLTY